LIIVADRASLFLLQCKLAGVGFCDEAVKFPEKVSHRYAGVISSSWGSLLTQSAQTIGCPAHWRHLQPSVKGNWRDRLDFGANPPISFCVSQIAIRGAPPPIAMQDSVVCSQENTARPKTFCKMRPPTGVLPRDASRSPKSRLPEPERPFICRWRRDTGKR